MIQASGVIICLGYILGLLFTAVPRGGFWVLALGVVLAVVFKVRRPTPLKPPQIRKNVLRTLQKDENSSSPLPIQFAPKPRVWLVAGVVGLLASLYFQLRIPQPGVNDVSTLVPSEKSNHHEQLFIVRGEVISTPRLTRNQRGQFWFTATQLDEIKNDFGPASVSKGITGKLYVTVPLLAATGLHPGQQIAVTGVLYKPQPPLNPGGFDFQQFLQQEGAFAGLSGRQVSILDEEGKWGWWKIRQRIVRSHVRLLGIPDGPLVSAMVLGSKAVDLPYDIRDLFVRAGLAHVLGSAGLKTSLILSVVLGLARRSTRVTQFTLGCIALIIFLGLTGFQPAVLKAVIMGLAALIGIGLKRKIKKLGALLFTAVLLLLFNPLWIWDLGFQLSFLATLGLIVTVRPLIQRLDWLPPAIASLIALPLAATIWTLPLLLHVFSVIAIYSLPLNLLASPFISIISIGGMLSALVSLILPEVGSILSGLLYYPTHLFIELVRFFSQLPGASVAVGSISIEQMIAIYTIFILTWLISWWQKRFWFSLVIAFGLILIPIWHSASTLFRITVLASGPEPVLVIQDQGKVALINSGDEVTGRYTILPFLQQQGVNQIDWAIASDFQGNGSNSWLQLLQRLPVKVFYDYSPTKAFALVSMGIQALVQNQKGMYQPLMVGQTVNIGTTVVQLINDQLPILQLNILGQNWLLVGNLKPDALSQLVKTGGVPHSQVLWCPGESLKELVQTLQPQVAIASSTTLDPQSLSELNQSQTKVFITGRDGAIQWTPKGQFESFMQVTENKSSVL
ncbi:MAG: ComEC/Rec2 family competence protein [Stigonema ocellatum SAG 48.90 = DSM 106950]|nr:ComEC/Rec2 family competence protein [Stigonema ocellatum SAG 48.90 = DSM 106950]